MGVERLLQVIGVIAPDAIRVRPVAELAGRVMVDMSIVVYQMTSVGVKRNIVNAAGDPINHIIGVMHRMLSLMEAGVKPVGVFDGPPPLIKSAALAARRTRVAKSHWSDVRELLALMGVEMVTAPGEAEALAALGGTFATEDTDAIVFALMADQPSRVVFGLGADPTALIVDIPAARGQLTQDQFVDMCAMLGTDYNQGLRGSGVKRAPALISTHGSVEAVLAHLYPRGVPDNVTADVNIQGVRDTYKAEAESAKSVVLPPPTIADASALAAWLRGHGIGEKTVAAAVKRLCAVDR